MSVSVVIPACDAERYLGETLASVLGQTLPPTEVLVVDDGSTDDTASVVRNFGPRVRLVSQSRSGAAAARNGGAELTSGELLAFVDADDLWMPRKLELQVDALSEDAGLDMVFGGVEQFLSPELTEQQPGFLPPPVESPPRVVPGISVGTALIRRRTFSRVGEFATRWQAGEFIDWYARAVDAGVNALVLPELVMRRRIHTGNSGIRRSGAWTDYAGVLRGVLDRRRSHGHRGSPVGGETL